MQTSTKAQAAAKKTAPTTGRSGGVAPATGQPKAAAAAAAAAGALARAQAAADAADAANAANAADAADAESNAADAAAAAEADAEAAGRTSADSSDAEEERAGQPGSPESLAERAAEATLQAALEQELADEERAGREAAELRARSRANNRGGAGAEARAAAAAKAVQTRARIEETRARNMQAAGGSDATDPQASGAPGSAGPGAGTGGGGNSSDRSAPSLGGHSTARRVPVSVQEAAKVVPIFTGRDTTPKLLKEHQYTQRLALVQQRLWGEASGLPRAELFDCQVLAAQLDWSEEVTTWWEGDVARRARAQLAPIGDWDGLLKEFTFRYTHTDDVERAIAEFHTPSGLAQGVNETLMAWNQRAQALRHRIPEARISCAAFVDLVFLRVSARFAEKSNKIRERITGARDGGSEGVRLPLSLDDYFKKMEDSCRAISAALEAGATAGAAHRANAMERADDSRYEQELEAMRAQLAAQGQQIKAMRLAGVPAAAQFGSAEGSTRSSRGRNFDPRKSVSALARAMGYSREQVDHIMTQGMCMVCGQVGHRAQECALAAPLDLKQVLRGKAPCFQ